jgi:hypothetical protein
MVFVFRSSFLLGQELWISAARGFTLSFLGSFHSKGELD